MGLDMYLYRRIYVGNKYRKPKQQIRVVVPKGQKDAILPIKNIETAKISSITEDAGYWRKANAIHKWFVENVQDGEDDCKEYYVEQEKLEQLLELCNKVLGASKLVVGKINNGYTINKKGEREYTTIEGKIIEDPSVAKELLPTTEGFFFGSTDYDEYYLKDIEETKKILEEALKQKDGEFYYQSSW